MNRPIHELQENLNIPISILIQHYKVKTVVLRTLVLMSVTDKRLHFEPRFVTNRPILMMMTASQWSHFFMNLNLNLMLL